MSGEIGQSSAPPKHRILTTLRKAGINFPETPHGRPTPSPWLARGETQDSRLLGRDLNFKPNPGKNEMHGVFLGDNAWVLMPGIVYVFDSSNVATNWLIAGSLEMQAHIEDAAAQHTPALRLDTYGGYVNAAQEVYKRRPVYVPREGIATTPYELPVAAASLILVPEEIMQLNGDRIPENIRKKILNY